MKKRTTLYRYWDSRGHLLYVGITGSGMGRMHSHSSASKWWRYVARAEFVHYPTREAALEAETLAIQTERPMYNRAKRVFGPRRVHEVLAMIDALPPVAQAVGCSELAYMIGTTASVVRRAADSGWFRPIRIYPRTYIFKRDLLREDIEDFLWSSTPLFKLELGKESIGPYLREAVA